MTALCEQLPYLEDLEVNMTEHPFALSNEELEKALGLLFSRRLDDGDIYMERQETEAVSIDEGIIKRASRSSHQGLGVRGVLGANTAYAHSNVFTAESLNEAAKAASAISNAASSYKVNLGKPSLAQGLYPVSQDPLQVDLVEKIELLREIDAKVRAYDSRIHQVQASFVSQVKDVLIVTQDGRMIFDKRPLSRLSVSCIAVDDKKGLRQSASSGGGGRWDFPLFFDIHPETGKPRWESWALEAARRAILLLEAEDAPAGAMQVVLGPGWPGILLHEAVGHGLEGDFNRKGTSAFSGRLGQRVASELVTVVDDGTISGRRGSLNVDDEGTPTQRNVLIENGILKQYMQDRLNGRLMKTGSSGNGRRESYAFSPMPRMTNTFMLKGQDDPEDIIRSVKHGVYAVAFGGGQVDITSGKFTFRGAEAYLIEDGKITAPLRGATFIGMGPEVLKEVSHVGHDLKLDEGVGTCGKAGQSVPVGVGLPTIRVNNLTVGGAKK